MLRVIKKSERIFLRNVRGIELTWIQVRRIREGLFPFKIRGHYLDVVYKDLKNCLGFLIDYNRWCRTLVVKVSRVGNFIPK